MEEGGEAERQTPALEEPSKEDRRRKARRKAPQPSGAEHRHTRDFSLHVRNFALLKEARMNMKRLSLLDLKIPARAPASRGAVPHIPHRSDSPRAVFLSAFSLHVSAICRSPLYLAGSPRLSLHPGKEGDEQEGEKTKRTLGATRQLKTAI